MADDLPAIRGVLQPYPVNIDRPDVGGDLSYTEQEAHVVQVFADEDGRELGPRVSGKPRGLVPSGSNPGRADRWIPDSRRLSRGPAYPGRRRFQDAAAADRCQLPTEWPTPGRGPEPLPPHVPTDHRVVLRSAPRSPLPRCRRRPGSRERLLPTLRRHRQALPTRSNTRSRRDLPAVLPGPDYRARLLPAAARTQRRVGNATSAQLLYLPPARPNRRALLIRRSN
jgi:hypothetical protein